MADANELLTAFSTVGGTITGVVAVLMAWGKAREMANKPLEDMKSALSTQISGIKTELEKSVTAISSDMKALRKDVDALNVHFDVKGGDVRGKLDAIEARLAKMDALSANERAELKGLITDLKPILHELRERS